VPQPLNLNVGHHFMHKLTVADEVWNRACDGGGDSPRAGDQALAALLLFHGPAMNGGVLHAIECLSSDQLSSALAGYRYFGFESVAVLISEAENTIQPDLDIDTIEAVFDQQYLEKIPDDGKLANRFESHQRENPNEYSPFVRK
jgi:hypothetical protein